MKVGYARVSTEDQLLDLQLDALHAQGCQKVFTEKMTGASRNRPALQAALKSLRQGDVLVVWKLDRLGRSLRDLIDIVWNLKARKIGFHSISDSIDSVQPSGILLFHILGAIAEFDRAMISERTRAGMRAAHERGKRLGRSPALSKEQIEQAVQLACIEHVPMAEIAARFHVGRTTLWRALSHRGAVQPPQ
jgi:DNA invertase Pin-like site-specific DNA recombinase